MCTELLHAEVQSPAYCRYPRCCTSRARRWARWLYEEGERPWGDVDVLVAPSQMNDALAVLAERGLVERYAGVNRQTTEDHAITVARADPEIGVDEFTCTTGSRASTSTVNVPSRSSAAAASRPPPGP